MKRNPALDSAKAFRLAAADFYYALDPSVTASLCNITKPLAARLRNSEAYRDHLDSLVAQDKIQVKEKMSKDSDRIRGALAAMVPQALEVMRGHLEESDGVVSLQAAREILDRDGRMPKVSRVQTQQEIVSKIPDVDADILAEFQPAEKPN
jgi:hypothetical protein